NRTSPFAFTGNKFEFRMLGTSNSIACANIMLNSAVAESLKIYADRLELAEDFETTLHEMIRKTIRDHKRIIFNGNGYDDAWIKEATEQRGLLNYRTTADCMPHLLDKKNADMLLSHGVFSEPELRSRCEIMLENYCKTILIEGATMVTMARGQILPAVERYTADVASRAMVKKTLDASLPCAYETGIVAKLSALTDAIAAGTDALEDALRGAEETGDYFAQSAAIRDEVLTAMETLRASCDEAETLTAKEYWPFPTYADLLFSVQ
ncbi:MAG: glutamine synthetase type III, partial [Clostridia bacterium]|nr:glutamine synthetase type III [Clostridia bacterium]